MSKGKDGNVRRTGMMLSRVRIKPTQLTIQSFLSRLSYILHRKSASVSRAKVKNNRGWFNQEINSHIKGYRPMNIRQVSKFAL